VQVEFFPDMERNIRKNLIDYLSAVHGITLVDNDEFVRGDRLLEESLDCEREVGRTILGGD
jgi:hypothetical protein